MAELHRYLEPESLKGSKSIEKYEPLSLGHIYSKKLATL
jgi:hypothetical protein